MSDSQRTNLAQAWWPDDLTTQAKPCRSCGKAPVFGMYGGTTPEQPEITCPSYYGPDENCDDHPAVSRPKFEDAIKAWNEGESDT